MYLTPYKMESLSSTIERSGKMYLIHLSIFISVCILTMCRNLNIVFNQNCMYDLKALHITDPLNEHQGNNFVQNTVSNKNSLEENRFLFSFY